VSVTCATLILRSRFGACDSWWNCLGLGARTVDDSTEVDCGDDSDGRGRFLLGGGPALPGVDYMGAYLRSQALAQCLNEVFASMGLRGDAVVFAQASLADDGSGAFLVRGTLEGGRVLLSVLEQGRGAGS